MKSQLLDVTSYNMVYLPRFIYFLYFSHLKTLQILPQNKHKSVIETGKIIEAVTPVWPSYIIGSKNFASTNCYIGPLRLESLKDVVSAR